jgi:hypothetical protein
LYVANGVDWNQFLFLFVYSPENASAAIDGRAFNARSQFARSDAISVVFVLPQDSADA